jgi:hypothetical protein
MSLTGSSRSALSASARASGFGTARPGTSSFGQEEWGGGIRELLLVATGGWVGSISRRAKRGLARMGVGGGADWYAAYMAAEQSGEELPQ